MIHQVQGKDLARPFAYLTELALGILELLAVDRVLEGAFLLVELLVLSNRFVIQQ